MKPNMIYICLIQVEFGAGDTHGPLLGLKIFRNLTSRWWVQRISVVFEQVTLLIKPLFMIKPFLKNVCHFFCYKLHTIEYIVYWEIFVFFSFTTAHCGMQFSSRGIRPGLTTMLARHLDKNTMGYLQWRWGTQSSMNTSIVRDTKSSHFTFAVQVRHCLIFMPMFCFCS